MGIGRIALVAKPGVLHVDVRQIVAALAAMAMSQLRMQNIVLVLILRAAPRTAGATYGDGIPVLGYACRFQKLDSSVPVMQSAQDCMCDDVPEAVDRAPVRRILSERNMRTPPIIIGGEFRKDPPQVLFVEHDQMIGTLAPDRPDQALNMAVLPGRAE